jgi:hypothetical protein
MPDNTARVLHNFDEQTGGAENPHIRDPDTGVFRKFIHSDVFVSNNIPRALRKYRTAADREIYYGNDRGRFSLFCYGYLFKAIDIKRAKFAISSKRSILNEQSSSMSELGVIK